MEDWGLKALSLGYVDVEEMWQELSTQQLSAGQIAVLLQVTRPTVLVQLRKRGLPIRMRGGANNVSQLRRLASSDPKILDKPTKQLCREYNIQKGTVYQLRKQMTRSLTSTTATQKDESN